MEANPAHRGLGMTGAVRARRLDHLVLTVRDIEATCAFYRRVLGMRAITFDGGRSALVVGRQKINLHTAGAEFGPKAARPTPGSADLCFVTDTPLPGVARHLSACGVDILEGPVRRAGARGPLESVYIRDPDGNLIEISNDAGARARPRRRYPPGATP